MGCSSSKSKATPPRQTQSIPHKQSRRTNSLDSFPEEGNPLDTKLPSPYVSTASNGDGLGADAIVLEDIDENTQSSGSTGLGKLVEGVYATASCGGSGRLAPERGPAPGTSISTITAATAITELEQLCLRFSSSRTASDPAMVDMRSLSPFASVPNESVAEGEMFWRDLPASEFKVRGPGYSTNHTKQASEASLYNCRSADVLKGSKGLDSILRHKTAQEFDWWRDAEGDIPWDIAWGVPRVLIVNCLLPIHSPMGFSKKPPGCALISYFELSHASRLELQDGKPGPQMKLWQRLCKLGVSTRDGTSFKAIGQVPSRSLEALPKMLHGYNGKPVLVTESAIFVKDMLPEVLEVDVDVGKWAYLARQTLYSYQGILAEHAFHMGYLVEGRTEDELPECLLGCVCMNGADLSTAMNLDNL